MATSLQVSGLKLIGVTQDRWARSTGTVAPTPGSGSRGHCHQAALCSEESSSTCPHTRAAPVDREHTRASPTGTPKTTPQRTENTAGKSECVHL